MRLTSTTLALASLSLVVPVLLAGCGDDDETTTDATSTSSVTTTSTSSGMGGDMSSSSSSTSSGMGGMGMGGSGGMGTGGSGGMGTGGTGGMGMGGSGGGGPVQSAYVWGDWDTNSTDELGIIDFPGGTVSKPTLMGITAIDDINDLAVSPDGTKVAIAVEADSNPVQILVYNADGSGAPVLVASAASTDAGVNDMAWSPDGMQLAFVADWNTNGHNIVLVANADGTSAAPKVVSQETLQATQDAYNVTWVNNTIVAYQGDLVVNGEDNLYTSDVTLAVPAPVPMVPEAMTSDGAEVRSGAQLDAAGKLYFRSSHMGGFYLFRVDADGQNLEQVAAPAALTNGNGQAEVGDFAISPDGMQIAFSADAPNAELYQVYVATNLGMAASTLQSNVQAVAVVGEFRGPIGNGTIVWSPDQALLAVIADWQVNAMDGDNDQSAFIVPASGAAGGVRILASSGGNTDVNSIFFTPDSSRIFARGDLVTNNDTEVHSTADFVTADQEANTVVVDVPMSGDVAGIALKP